MAPRIRTFSLGFSEALFRAKDAVVYGTPRVAAWVNVRFEGLGAREVCGRRMYWAWEPEVVNDWWGPDVLYISRLRRSGGPSWGMLVVSFFRWRREFGLR